MAPDVGLIGSNFLKSTYPSNEALSLGYGNHSGYSANLNRFVDIFNLSYGVGISRTLKENDTWGYGGRIASNYEKTYLSSGVANLRDSKGAIYVKSSGNDFNGRREIDGVKTTFYCGPGKARSDNMPCGDAALDNSHSLPYMIITGSLRADDVKSSYSTPGASLWIAGFGGEYGQNYPAIMSTDQSSCLKGYVRVGAGYSNAFNNQGTHPENPYCNYTSSMNGTSAAAPTVSGVIALMLDANPALTWRDVKHILASTSVQVDPTRAKVLNDITQYSWIINSANYKHHPWYGFGRINAAAAIAAAKAYTAGSLGTFISTPKATYVKDADDETLVFDLDSNTTNAWTFDQSTPDGAAGIIEFITLSFELSHSIPEDLGITLTSPAGTTVRVLMPYTGATDNPSDSSFDIGVSGLYGESMDGTWTVSLTDYSPDSVGGTMKTFSIKLYGH